MYTMYMYIHAHNVHVTCIYMYMYCTSYVSVWCVHVCLCACVQEVIAEGYSGSQTLSQLHSRIVSMDTLTDKQKSIVAERMGVSSSQYMYIICF